MNVTSETLSEPMIYEHSYQQNHESNVSSDKTTGNISSKTDQFTTSSQNTLEAKENETQNCRMVTEVMENYRNEEVGQSPLILAVISKGARCDREPLRLPCKKILNFFKE